MRYSRAGDRALSLHTAWVRPTKLVSGQDHLATRAICEVLYAQLLPGVTNVTDRARYYTFYPWLLWSMDQQQVAVDRRVDTYRRADCLFTLIGMRHARTAPGPAARHEHALVGRNALVKARTALEGGAPVRLSTFATLADVTERYFKNRRGGLSQYYLGSLLGLGVLARQGQDVTWASGLGEQVARSMDAGIDRARFFAVLDRDEVSLADLDAFAALCPCQLAQTPAERTLLSDIFAGETAGDPGAPRRRATLGLILDLAHQLEAQGKRLDLVMFRGATATGTLPGGAPWVLPPGLDATRREWATYQRNEWLSVALQGVFWATLADLGIHHRLPDVASFGAHAAARFRDALDVPPDSTVADACGALALPEFSDWSAPGHELQLALAIVDGANTDAVARASVRLLLALQARNLGEAPYAGLQVTDRHLATYPANLAALRAMHLRRWRDLRVVDFLADVATEWGLRLHLRVALRKLQHETVDTFQVRPVDGGFEIEGAPPPVFGSPRFDQAVQMLVDLGALGEADGLYRSSAEGRALRDLLRV